MAAPKHRTTVSRQSRNQQRQVGGDRRGALLDAAAKCFGELGFAGASIREIAKHVGILPGSIYHHFPSKNALMLAVYEEGVRHILDAVQHRLKDAGSDPWDRLEAACVGHLEALLSGSPYTAVVAPHFTTVLSDESLRQTLIMQRDSYESLFTQLVENLSLPPHTNHHYLRLALLGSLNWALTWYNTRGDAPAFIAHQILQFYRLPLEQTPTSKGKQ